MRRQCTFVGWVLCVTAMAAGPALAVPSDPPREAWAQMDWGPARAIPVQYGGRVMPLDTLAREVIWQVTGRRSWQGYDPIGLLLAWTWQGQEWSSRPVVLVDSPSLQKHLGLAEDRKAFALSDLVNNEPLMRLMMSRSDSEPATPIQRNAEQVASRLETFSRALSGDLLRILPAKDPNGTWTSPVKADGDTAEPGDRMVLAAVQKMREGFQAGDSGTFAVGATELTDILAAAPQGPHVAPSLLALEVRYNLLRPFQWGWILTFLALAVGLVETAWANRMVKLTTWLLLVSGFAALTAGIVMRWSFSGHAPLATMYESLVFMGWGVVLIGLVTAAIVRLRGALPIVAGVATAILVVADTTPLDAMAAPLMPVLRNTAWLTYHVLTIMLAYSALALAMGVGHVQAVALAYGKTGQPRSDQLGRLLYGMILVGCVFLTAGIIFGAIWANKSWGRYWGWDPKETWSLITLLGYMAVLHARRIGWFGSFGLAAASILCFQLVVMTYYGVNFVLGSGLHSYGFSSGGQLWMGLYEVVETAFLVWMWLAHSRAATRTTASLSQPAEPIVLRS